MAVKLSCDDRMWLLKSYCKVENVVEVQRRWRLEFGTPPPTRLAITRIWDKLEVDGTVQDVLKDRCGRKRSSTDNESADAVMQVFSRSQRSHWGNVLVRLLSRNPVFIELWTYTNPDGMSLCSMSLLRLYCGRRWTVWTCAGLKMFKEQNTT